MSVSWQPSQHSAFQLGVHLGGPSTSSSDYGNWFQHQPKAYPAPPGQPQASGQRRNPTRKLGALAISESGEGVGHGGATNRPSTVDQTGRVNSFLSKVSQEDNRVPRSPRTPELLDLPGRIVRAPRTRHMTPCNSPDAGRYSEIGESYNIQGSQPRLGGGPGYAQMSLSRDGGFERSKTMIDMSPRVHGELQTAATTSQAHHHQNPFSLQRSTTMLHQGSRVGDLPNQYNNSAVQNQRALQPLNGTPQYDVPKFPFDRSQTMMSFNSTNNAQFAQSNANNEISPRLQALQRSNSNLDLSKFSQSTNGNTAAASEAVSWNFRRMPSFVGNLPSNQNGSLRKATDTFQDSDEPPREPQFMLNNHLLSRYMFTTIPDSNTKKHSAEGYQEIGDSGGMKPRIPMYWLYGSRGRPGAGNNEVPNNSPRNDRIQDGTSGIVHIPSGQQLHPDESDFLATSIDRRDAYRSNYSSYNDQRATQSEPDKSEFRAKLGASAAAIAAADTVSLPDEPKTKGILKKESAYAGVGASRMGQMYPMRAGHSGRLPGLATNKRRTTSKRVTFAM